MSNGRTVVRALAMGLPIIGLAIALSSQSTSASSATEFRFRDDCNPASFNNIIGPGTCVGNGNTTFPMLLQLLTEDLTVGAWNINPNQTGLDSGQPTVLTSRGGEFHTFTRVANFGGGIIPILNVAPDTQKVAPECAALQDPSVPSAGSTPIPPGSVTTGPTAGSAAMPVGMTHFQCCIHPWMRTTVEVKAQHDN
jgi:hypothetical protein